MRSAYLSRGSIRIAKEEYDRAVSDFDVAVGLGSTDAGGLGSRGFAHFLAGRFDRADRDLSDAYNLSGRNAYTALFLHLSRVRSGGAGATNELKDAAARSKDWPEPIVRVFLGDLSPEKLAPVALPGDAKRFVGQQCEADYFVGQWHLIRGERAAAQARTIAAKASCPHDYREYEAATAELRR